MATLTRHGRRRAPPRGGLCCGSLRAALSWGGFAASRQRTLDRVLEPSTVYFEVVQRPGAPLWPPIVPLGLLEAGRCTPDISEVDEVTQNLSYPVSSVIKREKLRFRQRLPRSNLPTSATIDLVVS